MYGLLAKYEPEFLSAADYRRYAANVVSHCGRGAKGLDAGCGTGALSRALSHAGLVVTGLDIDTESLNRAVLAAASEALPVKFVRGDASKGVKGFHSLAFITAATDVVNHMPAPDVFFRSCFDALDAGGVLIFDISSAYKLKNFVAGQTFTRFEAHFVRIWNNTYVTGKNRIDMELTYFVPSGGVYTREDAGGVQYIHETGELKAKLEDIGFRVGITGSLTEEPEQDDGMRCYFTAHKP